MLSSLLSSLITVVLSGCFWTLDSWFFSTPICVRVCSPCSLQVVSFIPIAILLPGCFGKNGFPGLCFSLLAFLCGSLCDLGRNHTKPIIRYSVTFPYPGSLPYVTLLAFLLVPNLSPYHLSTTVLLSRSPAFGTEKRAFILFRFFHYLLL